VVTLKIAAPITQRRTFLGLHAITQKGYMFPHSLKKGLHAEHRINDLQPKNRLKRLIIDHM
jgi:hypothetical protein